MTKTLGQFIREKRESLDMSLRELAKKLEITPAFLSDIELGRRNPSNDVLTNIAREIRVPLDELKKLDVRATLGEIKRATTRNPMYGVAFRKAIESGLSPEDLIKAVEKKMKKNEEGI